MIAFKNLVGAIGLEPTTPPCQGYGLRLNVMNFDHYFGPMTREYDFSGLTKPLCECVCAYVARTQDGRYEVLVVQDEGLTPPDITVYATLVARSAQDAAVEVEGMIKAAKLLAGKP